MRIWRLTGFLLGKRGHIPGAEARTLLWTERDPRLKLWGIQMQAQCESSSRRQRQITGRWNEKREWAEVGSSAHSLLRLLGFSGVRDRRHHRRGSFRLRRLRGSYRRMVRSHGSCWMARLGGSCWPSWCCRGSCCRCSRCSWRGVGRSRSCCSGWRSCAARCCRRCRPMRLLALWLKPELRSAKLLLPRLALAVAKEPRLSL